MVKKWLFSLFLIMMVDSMGCFNFLGLIFVVDLVFFLKVNVYKIINEFYKLIVILVFFIWWLCGVL